MHYDTARYAGWFTKGRSRKNRTPSVYKSKRSAETNGTYCYCGREQSPRAVSEPNTHKTNTPTVTAPVGGYTPDTDARFHWRFASSQEADLTNKNELIFILIKFYQELIRLWQSGFWSSLMKHPSWTMKASVISGSSKWGSICWLQGSSVVCNNWSFIKAFQLWKNVNHPSVNESVNTAKIRRKHEALFICAVNQQLENGNVLKSKTKSLSSWYLCLEKTNIDMKSKRYQRCSTICVL